jgi:hypothetical protein
MRLSDRIVLSCATDDSRTRWLCERTMRSDARMDEIATQLAEMQAQQKATMEKLDVLLSMR